MLIQLPNNVIEHEDGSSTDDTTETYIQPKYISYVQVYPAHGEHYYVELIMTDEKVWTVHLSTKTELEDFVSKIITQS